MPNEAWRTLWIIPLAALVFALSCVGAALDEENRKRPPRKRGGRRKGEHMSTVIISDDMTQPYGEIVTNFLHKISEKGVQKIAMVGMADAADDVIIGYYNMETADKAKAAMHILSDATIEMVAANIDRLLDALNDLPDTEEN
jgi:hypothetical protein